MYQRLGKVGAAVTGEDDDGVTAVGETGVCSSALGLSGAGGRGGGGRVPPAAVWVEEHGRVEAVVPAGVLAQVVAPHEALGAERAGEALLAGVGADVARQLVRARELLGALGPGALERPLA